MSKYRIPSFMITEPKVKDLRGAPNPHPAVL